MYQDHFIGCLLNVFNVFGVDESRHKATANRKKRENGKSLANPTLEIDL